MDYIILYSNYSESSAALFDMFSNLQDLKGVCIDAPELRAAAVRLNVALVPTLLITSGHRIVQHIVGLEHIRNWLIIEHGLNPPATAPPAPAAPAASNEGSFQPVIQTGELPPKHKNARALAEEMQRERDELLKSSSQTNQTR